MEKIFNYSNLPQDKANHAFWGLTLYSFIALYSPMVAICIVAILAIGKEVYDKYNKGAVDVWDAIWTALGGAVVWVSNTKEII